MFTLFRRILFLAVPVWLSFSCSSSRNEDRLTYTVSRKNFENVLYIDGEVHPVRSTTLTAPRTNEGTLAFMVEDGTFVEEGEVVCVIEVNELSSRYEDLVLAIENAQASLNKTKADLKMQYALLEAQVKSNEAQTRISQLDSLQLRYSTPNQRRITELQLESALIERRKYQEKLKALEVIQQTDLKRREYQLQRRVGRADEVKRQLESLTIHAPHKGVVIRSYSWETGEKFIVGDAVYGNQPLITMPDLSVMKVIIRAPEADYKYINAGDSVTYAFDAMPGKAASGHIVKKSPVGQPIRRNSTFKVFEIEASIDSMDQIPEPGFSVGCYVMLKQVADTVVIPQIAVFDQDSMKVVYIPRGRNYEMREIQIGLASPKEVIITRGLNPDEKVLLTRPEESRIKKVTRLPEPEKSPESQTKTQEIIETE